MKVLLVDDESAARRRLGRLLTPFLDVQVVGEAKDGLEAVCCIESLQPDLVFLDVRMPELDGFEALRAVSCNIRMPLVVFATSFDDYALQAFDANALAYLLKPVEQPRLRAVIERARKLLVSEDDRTHAEHRVHSLLEQSRPLRRIICRKLNYLLPVDPMDIFWFSTEEGLVRAQTSQENLRTHYQLTQLERALNPELFFRARREVLLNLTRVRFIHQYDGGTYAVVMSDENSTEIIVSERKSRELRARFPGL